MIFAANAQVGPVVGTVTSHTDGAPMAGVMVRVEGTMTAAITDGEGKYSIGAKQGDVLSYAMLGFVKQSVTVGASTTIDVVMETDTTAIDEVVVIGYGVQKKSVVTAAISSVKAADLETQTPRRLEW